MKVVFLMDQMYIHGGGEKILSLKMNALASYLGCKVYLVTTNQKNNQVVYKINEKINWNDLNINYKTSHSYFHPLNLLKAIKHFFKLKKVLKRINPDVVISVSQSPEQFFIPFINKKIPKIKEFHSSGVSIKQPTTLKQKLKHQLFLLYGKYEAIVLLNNDEKKYYPFKNIMVIPNFISSELNSTNSQINREKVIIAAGRIAPVKQFDHLIKAWALIAKKYPDWEVYIYGEGDETLVNELQILIKKLELSSVKLEGTTDNLAEKMKAASIYAMNSATECFPMVLLESLACGLPIISYDCPNGPRNIISNGEDGLLIESNNIDAFSVALSELIKNKKTRLKMSDNALNTVKRFKEQEVMQQWIQLFNSMV